MKQTLINTLETICPNNVYLQGTLANDVAYPESFITFFTTSSDDDAFYDNDENRVTWFYSVIYYSSNPATIPTQANAIRTALKAAGFIPQNHGRDIPSDRVTHTGWAMDFAYSQRII